MDNSKKYTKELIIRAIEKRMLLEFSYNGHHRLVEPHRYGISRTGNENLLAYQTRGSGVKGKIPGWKTFVVSGIADLKLVHQNFVGPRNDYKHGDPEMDPVYAEL